MHQAGNDYSHYALDYNIKKSVGFFKLMTYELLTIIKDLYQEDKIICFV